MRQFPSLMAASLGVVLLAGCAAAPIHRDDKELKQAFSDICSIARDVKSARGEAWFKVDTPEEKGQFPAQFVVKAPGTLDMEITDLVGTVQASLKIRGSEYKIHWYGREAVEENDVGSWRGIPLNWAVELMLGRIPCPSVKADRVALSDDGNGGLVAVAGSERFTYQLKKWAGHDWPEALKWETRGANPNEIDFTFDSPEDQGSSPGKWSAQSSSGEVKFRLKHREKLE